MVPKSLSQMQSVAQCLKKDFRPIPHKAKANTAILALYPLLIPLQNFLHQNLFFYYNMRQNPHLCLSYNKKVPSGAKYYA